MSECVCVCVYGVVRGRSERAVDKQIISTNNQQATTTNSLSHSLITISRSSSRHQVAIISRPEVQANSPWVLSSKSGLDAPLSTRLHRLLNHLRSSAASLPLSFTHSLTLHSLHFALCIQQPTQYYNK